MNSKRPTWLKREARSSLLTNRGVSLVGVILAPGRAEQNDRTDQIVREDAERRATDLHEL
jgi:hypothetical protein